MNCTIHLENEEVKESFVCPLDEIVNPMFKNEQWCTECFKQIIQSALDEEEMTETKRFELKRIMENLV